MSFFLDTKETSQRFGNNIAEFRSLLDTNHIRHGSPDNIFEFTRILDSSNLFRIDLSAMVKSIVQKETEEILLTDMMSIIMTSVGGPSFAEAQADITKPTNTLMEFLLGTGCWKQFGSFSSPISKNAGPSPNPPARTEEPRFTRLTSPTSATSAIPTASENPEDQARPPDTSNELRQMLARIEINTQQVKRHLDSIEQRINKIEPPPDVLTAQTTSPPAPLPHPDSADIAPEEIAPPTAEDTSVFEPELPNRTNRSRAMFALEPQEEAEINDFPSPTFAYASENGKSIIPFWILLALLGIIAVFLFIYFGQGRAILKAGKSGLENVRAFFSSVPAAVSPAPTATAPSAPMTSPPVAAAPSSSAAPPSSPKNMTKTPSAHPEASDGASTNISSDAQPAPANPKIRYVPANVMEGYLLSAPRPQYPPLARINHIQGSVALQATISKRGSIETLHVLKGPQALRSAAIDAVRNWHYKPYSVAGRPEEVVTTVYVDFTLKPPPMITR